ncbi:GyrI-like domain-containing protein [Micromonospora sp. NPDC047467]|uniref:GyrI-like domain-containing protein n=1 Tax=Micromonospora sp. NPDC047467 TaxID=3154814 RepID=UPI003411D08F
MRKGLTIGEFATLSHLSVRNLAGSRLSTCRRSISPWWSTWGPHDDIDVTYGRLGAWVISHALGVAGPVHETYLVGPRDTGDPARWRTELGWPVFRLTSG